MNITIEKAILHILDTNIDMPVLSQTELELSQDITKYFEALLSKVVTDDNIKQNEFLPESRFLSFVDNFQDDFLTMTQTVSQEIFSIMIRNVAIPNADLAFILCEIDDLPYIVMLKLDYKTGYIHYLEQNNNVNIIKQRTVLPNISAKINEAFLINLNCKNINLLEKQYEIDGIKSFYLSSYLLQSTPHLSPKEKLDTVLESARIVNEVYYGDESSRMESHVITTICNESNNNLSIDLLCDKIYGENDSAKQEFYHHLSEQKVEASETLELSKRAVKRLEKQSIKSDLGVEIKIPIELYRNSEAVEFINNPDGSVSLLIKNITL